VGAGRRLLSRSARLAGPLVRALGPHLDRYVVRRFHELYYEGKERTWGDTRWLGAPAAKCPLDLWVYQELIHDYRPDRIVECGTARGGSAAFLAAMCDLVGHGEVVSIDVDQKPGRPEHPRLAYWAGSSTDPAVVARVVEWTAPAERVLVILDSDHSCQHVLAELRAYGDVVRPGGWLVVEDTNIGGHPVMPGFHPGPMEAVQEFLAEDDRYEVDRSKEKFMLTFNPSGFLRRVR
jgi:cephalosporin hydroxylase